jgi:hypothetical protein
MARRSIPQSDVVGEAAIGHTDHGILILCKRVANVLGGSRKKAVGIDYRETKI